MKVELLFDAGSLEGCLKILAENDVERYALKRWCAENIKENKIDLENMCFQLWEKTIKKGD